MQKSGAEHNQIMVRGEIVTALRFSHEIRGEKFYEMELLVERLSENVDVLPVMISERQLNVGEDYRCERVSITGQLRSFYYNEGEKRHLQLHILANDILFLERKRTTINTNEIYLDGFLCKPAYYRVTPRGKEISEMMVAVTNDGKREDYIPCICWGRNARYIREMEAGVRVRIWGRFQSREYVKWDEKKGKTMNITYEVSINRLW